MKKLLHLNRLLLVIALSFFCIKSNGQSCVFGGTTFTGYDYFGNYYYNVCAGDTAKLIVRLPSNFNTNSIINWFWYINNTYAPWVSGTSESISGNVITLKYANPSQHDTIDFKIWIGSPCPPLTPYSGKRVLNLVQPHSGVGVNIIPDKNPFCLGDTVNFQASPTYSGTPETYTWKVNGFNFYTGPEDTFAADFLKMFDTVTCEIYEQCATQKYASDDEIMYATAPYVEVYNTIDNHSAFNGDTIILLSTSTEYSPSTDLKICADGSNATKISFSTYGCYTGTDIRFYLAGNQTADSNEYGYFSNYQVNNGVVTAEFHHPNYVDASYKPYRSDEIQIVNKNNPNNPIYEIPIRVYRAPLLLVHGLDGDLRSFKKFKHFLQTYNYYDPILVENANYKQSNTYSFASNSWVIPFHTSKVLKLARSAGFSASKVDLIGHSMGGILARRHLQAHYYQNRNDISRLITLNTPHSGSHIANLVRNTQNSSQGAFINDLSKNKILQFFFPLMYKVDNGAVRDLSIGSNAYDNLNNIRLNNNIVPSRSILTYQKYGDLIYNNQIPEAVLLKLLCIQFDYLGQQDVDACINELFNGENSDFVVSLSSQSGGLGSKYEFKIPKVNHIQSTKNIDVFLQLLTSLNTSSNDTNFFSHKGFHPITNIAKYKPVKNEQNTGEIGIPGSITIQTPTYGQKFDPNTSVPIKISSKNGIKRTILCVLNYTDSLYVNDVPLTNGTIHYTVSPNAFGKEKIIVFGFGDNGYVDFDTVSIDINQTSALDTITCYGDSVIAQVNNIAPISITALFQNGYDYSVNSSDGVTYSIADTSFVTMFRTDMLWGKKEGRTTLDISYQGKTTTVPVHVLAEDTSIHVDTSLFTSVENYVANSESAYSSIQVFPNPNKGSFTARINTQHGINIKTEVFNYMGQRVFISEDKADSRIYDKTVQLKGVSNGIYYIRMSSTEASYSSRVIVTD